jgi:hypothetical protein
VLLLDLLHLLASHSNTEINRGAKMQQVVLQKPTVRLRKHKFK